MKNLRINKNTKLLALIAAGVVLVGATTMCGKEDEKEVENNKIVATYIDENNEDDTYNFYDILDVSKRNVDNLFAYSNLLQYKEVEEINNADFKEMSVNTGELTLLEPAELEQLFIEYRSLKIATKKTNIGDDNVDLNEVAFQLQQQLFLSEQYINENANQIVLDYCLLMAKKYASEMLPGVDPQEIEIHYIWSKGSIHSTIAVPSTGQMYHLETTFNKDEANYIKILSCHSNVDYLMRQKEVDIEELKWQYNTVNEVIVDLIERDEQGKVKIIKPKTTK